MKNGTELGWGTVGPKEKKQKKEEKEKGRKKRRWGTVRGSLALGRETEAQKACWAERKERREG